MFFTDNITATEGGDDSRSGTAEVFLPFDSTQYGTAAQPDATAIPPLGSGTFFGPTFAETAVPFNAPMPVLLEETEAQRRERLAAQNPQQLPPAVITATADKPASYGFAIAALVLVVVLLSSGGGD